MSKKTPIRANQSIPANPRKRNASPVTKTIGKGRSYSIVSYEVDPRDSEDMLRGQRHAPRPPVNVTYYKPTRAQHYAAMGKIYGVHRQPGQSQRAYAKSIQKAIDAAMNAAEKRGGRRPKGEAE